MKTYILALMSIILLAACSIKHGTTEVSFFQMQLRKDSASIYSTKLYGVDLAFPVPMPTGSGDMRIRMGYGGETKSVIPVKNDGSLPDVLIDMSTTHGQNTNDLSDTYAVGEVSKQIYPACMEDEPVK